MKANIEDDVHANDEKNAEGTCNRDKEIDVVGNVGDNENVGAEGNDDVDDIVGVDVKSNSDEKWKTYIDQNFGNDDHGHAKADDGADKEVAIWDDSNDDCSKSEQYNDITVH